MKYEKHKKPRLKQEKSHRLTKRERQERRIERRAEKHRRRYEANKAARREFFTQMTEEQCFIVPENPSSEGNNEL